MLWQPRFDRRQDVPSFAPAVGSLKKKRHTMTNTSQSETVFNLTIDAQEMTVRYRPYHIAGLDPYAPGVHEPAQTRRRIPVSETGYRSFFAPMYEIEGAPSIEKHASMVASRAPRRRPSNSPCRDRRAAMTNTSKYPLIPVLSKTGSLQGQTLSQ
jgi:hypothetical protein